VKRASRSTAKSFLMDTSQGIRSPLIGKMPSGQVPVPGYCGSPGYSSTRNYRCMLGEKADWVQVDLRHDSTDCAVVLYD
jgi:hypothetical protein